MGIRKIATKSEEKCENATVHAWSLNSSPDAPWMVNNRQKDND